MEFNKDLNAKSAGTLRFTLMQLSIATQVAALPRYFFSLNGHLFVAIVWGGNASSCLRQPLTVLVWWWLISKHETTVLRIARGNTP